MSNSLIYRWRGSKLGRALHRIRLRLAHKKLDRAEAALVSAIRAINIYAIVSPQASALYRAYEARNARLNALAKKDPTNG